MATPLQKLVSHLHPIAHAISVEEPALLAALTGDVSRDRLQRLVERAKKRVHDDERVHEMLVEDAARALIRAYGYWRSVGVEERAGVCGCSTALLALAARQTLTLYRESAKQRRAQRVGARPVVSCLADARRKRQAEHELDKTAGRLRGALVRARQLFRRGERLLDTVAGLELDFTPGFADAAQAHLSLWRLADRLERQIDRPGIALRAQLLGLDSDFVALIRDAAEGALDAAAALGQARDALKGMEGETTDGPRRRRSRPTMEAAPQDVTCCAGLMLVLLTMIVEAFEAAHRLDPRVPLLSSQFVSATTEQRLPRRQARSGTRVRDGAIPGEARWRARGGRGRR